LRDEWKDPYLGIEEIFECFYGKSSKLNRADLAEIFDDVALLAMGEDFPGTTWITPLCEQIWELEDEPENWFDRYGKLLELLYHISFIGVIEGNKKKAVYSYVDEGHKRKKELSKATHFEVHVSLRPGLDLKD
jgi:hypothetical protein